MRTKTIAVEILEAGGDTCREEAAMVMAPSVAGQLGILPGHMPIIVRLTTGIVRLVRPGGEAVRFAVSGGFLEVGAGKVTILADAAEKVEEIDVQRALSAKKRAEERLRDQSESLDLARAQASLHRAVNRLRAVRGKDE